MKCRDRHKSIGNDDDYKFWRNKVIKMIQNAKKVQYQTFIENNKDNPSSIYKIFKEFGAGKCSKRQSIIGSVKVGDTLTEDFTGIANEFNDFFVNVASKLKEPVTNTNHVKLKEFCQAKLPADAKFVIPSSQKEKVLKFLSNIDINKATGLDMIGPHLLKVAAPYIADEITYICNHRIVNSVFPNKWKEKLITIIPYLFCQCCRKYSKSMYMRVSPIFCMNIIYCIKLSPASELNILVKLLLLI